MNSTFGAPAGALVSWVDPGLESSYVRPIFASVKSCSGLGSTFGLPFEDIGGDCRTQETPATTEASRSEWNAHLIEALLSCSLRRYSDEAPCLLVHEHALRLLLEIEVGSLFHRDADREDRAARERAGCLVLMAHRI